MSRFKKLATAATALLVGASLAGSVSAQSAGGQDEAEYWFEPFQVAGLSYSTIIVQLENAGYEVVDMKSTMLGRIRIRAQNQVHLREIVVSRSTGEIKRDVILKVFGGAGKSVDSVNGLLPKQAQSAQQATGGNASVSANVSSSGAGANVSVGGASVSVSTGGGIGIGN